MTPPPAPTPPASAPAPRTAPAADQERLLAVQGLDTRLAQLLHARRALPEHAALVALGERGARLADRLVAARTLVSDTGRELTRAETDVEAVRSRAQRTSARLADGGGSAKDLQALTRDAEALTRRLAELEDAELEVMERAESAGGELAELEAEEASLATERDQLVAARDAAVATINAEGREVTAQRAAAASGVDGALLAFYDRVRAAEQGLGAAPLVGTLCGGCRLELTPSYLAVVRAAAPDAVVRCEECGRILVRTAEADPALRR